MPERALTKAEEEVNLLMLAIKMNLPYGGKITSYIARNALEMKKASGRMAVVAGLTGNERYEFRKKWIQDRSEQKLY